MWKLSALAAVAVIGLPTSSEGENTQTPSATPCTPLRQVYSHKNWRDPHPARGENPCPGKVEKWKAWFGLYRHYRLIAPYSGFREGDPWLKWVPIPAGVIDCETNGYHGRGRWLAANPSGAVGPAQLLGWGAPYPANSPREKVRYWEITQHVLQVQGLSAWSCA